MWTLSCWLLLLCSALRLSLLAASGSPHCHAVNMSVKMVDTARRPTMWTRQSHCCEYFQHYCQNCLPRHRINTIMLTAVNMFSIIVETPRRGIMSTLSHFCCQYICHCRWSARSPRYPVHTAMPTADACLQQLICSALWLTRLTYCPMN